MTQQGDMTSQQPGPGQPVASPAAPYWPSPYLAEGQSVPEAYPAPARHGQPRYGEPASSFQAGSQARFGRPGYGQPQAAAAAQPGIAGPAGPGEAAGPASAAGLTLASAWERLLAMTLDWMLILSASYLLLHEQIAQLLSRFQAVMTAAQALGPTAERTALLNFEKDPATVSTQTSYWLMALLLALIYFWALEANGGATLGKRVLGLRVVRAAGKTPAGVWATGVRTILFLVGPAVFALATSAAIPLIGVLGAGIWFADSLVLATDPQKRALHDKLAGTMVLRKARQRSNG